MNYGNDSAFAPQALKDIGGGRRSKPKTYTTGGKLGSGKIVFTGNFVDGDVVSINGVAFTAKTAGAAGNQFNIDTTLSLSLDALVTALNGSAVAAVALATYTKTDANAGLTATMDNYDDVYNGTGFPLSTTHATAVVTAVANCEDMPDLDVNSEYIELAVPAGQSKRFNLPDGIDGMEKTIFSSTTGGAVVAGNFQGSNVTATFDAVGDFITLKWLAGEWKTLVNTSVALA